MKNPKDYSELKKIILELRSDILIKRNKFLENLIKQKLDCCTDFNNSFKVSLSEENVVHIYNNDEEIDCIYEYLNDKEFNDLKDDLEIKYGFNFNIPMYYFPK